MKNQLPPKWPRRKFIQSGTSALALLSTGLSLSQPVSRPNILLICSDQQHWKAAGFRDSFFKTPNLDALASRSVIFESAFCTTPQCSPSRSSLYTGLYPHKTGVTGNLGSIDHEGNPIPALPTTIPHVGFHLKQAGYQTGYFGKWHLGNINHHSQGFHQSSMDQLTDNQTTEAAKGFISSQMNKSNPWALFVNYLNPHDIYEYSSSPGQIPPVDPSVPLPPSWHEDDLSSKPPVQKQFMNEDQGTSIEGKPQSAWQQYRQLYREKCRLVDAELGKLLNHLESTGQASNTVIIYTSDHGDMDTAHRLIFKGPFMYEEMVRVPLLIAYPGGNSGTVSAGVILADIPATLYEVADITVPGLDGISLLSHLTGKAGNTSRPCIISEYYNKQKWVNPIRMIRTDQYKYNRYIHHGEELYDLSVDPYEIHNLAKKADFQDVRKSLHDQLVEWIETNQDPFFDLRTTTREGDLIPQRTSSLRILRSDPYQSPRFL